MSAKLELSILDFVDVGIVESFNRATANSLALAAVAERSGYSRYWISEHHSPGLACPSPEPVIAAIAARTSRIRVGSAGVALMLHAPIRIAETFRTLQGLFPGRIDLGIARSWTTVGDLLYRHLDGRPRVRSKPLYDARFNDRLAELIGLLDEARKPMIEGDKAYPGLSLEPGEPQLWLLGSGSESARLAAELGTNIALTEFYGNGLESGPVLSTYRDGFVPGVQATPATALALSGICAPTAAEAAALLAACPNRFLAANANFCGTPEQCRDIILARAVRAGVRHIVVKHLGSTLEGQAQSYRLLAEAVLGTRAGAGACGKARLPIAA